MQKEKIVNDILRRYNFPGGRYQGTPQRPLSDLVPALGGQPIRSIIIATRRSGSTFLGHIPNTIPGNYYHYEPLLDHGIVQIRGPPRAKQALQYIKQLLNCNYSYGEEHIWLFTHNTSLWEKYLEYPYLFFCLPQFPNIFSSLFPFQSMKLVRLRLKLAHELLADEKLGVKVVPVVRDPHGTMQSRRHRDWCLGNPDCALLCANYSEAIHLAQEYPKSFRVVRYEDFAVDPYKGTENLFNFVGMDFGAEVRTFSDTHTQIKCWRCIKYIEE